MEVAQGSTHVRKSENFKVIFQIFLLKNEGGVVVSVKREDTWFVIELIFQFLLPDGICIFVASVVTHPVEIPFSLSQEGGVCGRSN